MLDNTPSNRLVSAAMEYFMQALHHKYFMMMADGMPDAVRAANKLRQLGFDVVVKQCQPFAQLQVSKKAEQTPAA